MKLPTSTRRGIRQITILILLVFCFCSKVAKGVSPVWNGHMYRIIPGGVGGGGLSSPPPCTIDNEREQEYITKLMAMQDVDEVYIGLELGDYGFYWKDGTPVTYTNFKSGEDMPEFKFKRVCPRDPPAHLECMGGKAIRILNVFLGRRDSYECQPPDTPPLEHCASTAMAFDHVMNDCHGATSCEVSVNSYSSAQPNCDPQAMYLEIQYTCSVAVPCSPIPTTPATGGSCYRNVSAGDYCPDGFHRVEIESSKEQDRIIRDQKLQQFATGAMKRSNQFVWPTTGSKYGLQDLTGPLYVDRCVVFEESVGFEVRDCISPMKLVCERKVSFQKECVVMDAAGYWRTNNCSAPLGVLSEVEDAPPTPEGLDCQVQRANFSSTIICPDYRPVAVGCLCSCGYYEIIGRTCTCKCSSPEIYPEAMCCTAHVQDGLATTPANVTMTCEWVERLRTTTLCGGFKYCMKPPEMTLKLGGPTTLCVGVCCEVQVSYIGDQFEEDIRGDIDFIKATHILNATDASMCRTLCKQRAFCVAYQHLATQSLCVIADDVKRVAVSHSGNPPVYKRFQNTMDTLSSSLMNRMYSAEYYRRDLRAYAFGANMSYDTCQGACMADMECGVTYWSDNVCYVAELEDIRNGSCCTLFTNKSYIETNFGNVRGTVDFGSSLDCYSVTQINSSRCPDGDALTGCSCSWDTPYDQVFPNQCTCPIGRIATAVCCRMTAGVRQMCPPGQTSYGGRCRDCDPGTFSAAMGGSCPICHPGHVNNATGSTECEPCPLDTVPNKDHTDCVACPIGWTTLYPGGDECEIVDCGMPPNVSKAEKFYINTTYWNLVSYMCYEGYMLTNGTGFLVCTCMGNWTGDDNICENIDDCLSSPCMNNGTCEDQVLYYNCTCDVGYTGTHCETDIDECAPDPCHNNGTCSNLIGNYSCECKPGFTGRNCSINIDDCDPNPCFESNCTDLIMDYNCSCAEGRYGRNCTEGCGMPPRMLHAFPVLPDDFQPNDEAEVYYNCSIGYYPVDSNMIWCDMNIWEGNITCLPVNCSTPPEVEYAEPFKPTYTEYGDIAVYSCDEGFRLVNGTGLMTCTCSGEWIGDDFVCERLSSDTTTIEMTTTEESSNVTSSNANTTDSNMSNNTTDPMSGGSNTTDTMPYSDPTHPVMGTHSTPSMGGHTSDPNGGGGQGPHSNDTSMGNGDASTSSPLTTPANLVWDDGPVFIPPMPPGIPEFVANVYIQCAQAPDFPDTIRDNDTVFSGTYIRYRCPYGYWFASNNLSTLYVLCNEVGQWTPRPEGCVRVYCGPHPMPKNVQRNSESPMYGDPVEYQCDAGASFHDGSNLRTTQCLPGGKWSVIIPSCERNECSDLHTNAPFAQTNISRYGLRWAHLKCTGNDRFNDGRQERWVPCFKTGQWKRLDNDCRMDRCGPLPYIENAAVRHPHVTDVNRITRVDCLPGYRFPNGYTTRTFECLSRTPPELPQWDDTLPDKCEEVVCPPVPHIWYAIPNTDRARIGTSVTYKCTLAFRWFEAIRSPTIQIECFMNQTWAPTPYECEEIHCGGDLHNITGADMVTFGDIPGEGDMPTKQIHYRCREGMHYQDGSKEKMIRCNYQAEWEPVLDLSDGCAFERCNEPPFLENTEFIDGVDASNGSSVTYTCQLGYMFPDQSHTRNVTCLPVPPMSDPGVWEFLGVARNPLQWQPMIQEGCIPIICPALDRFPHIQYDMEDHNFGAEVNISCDPGFELIVAPENWTFITCTKYSNWSLTIDQYTCQPVNCSDIRHESYAFMSQTTRVAYMSHVFYQCYLGFEYTPEVWSKTLLCDETATWVNSDSRLPNNITECTVTHCPLLANWDDKYVFHTNILDAHHTEYTQKVNYSCAEGYHFHTLQPYHVIRCGPRKHWEPPQMVCYSENASIFDPVPVEAPQSKLIATVSLLFMSLVIGFIIALDIVSFSVKLSNHIQASKKPPPDKS